MKKLLDKHNITLYSTENEEKSSVAERWNRIIKQKMWKQFTVQNTTQYLDMLPKLLKEYNNTKHSSIKMRPVEALKKKNESSCQEEISGTSSEVSKSPQNPSSPCSNSAELIRTYSYLLI